jgi:hypothetical protein
MSRKPGTPFANTMTYSGTEGRGEAFNECEPCTQECAASMRRDFICERICETAY